MVSLINAPSHVLGKIKFVILEVFEFSSHMTFFSTGYSEEM